MALTLVSTTASERLLRHVHSLSEAEAEDALRLLVRLREQTISKRSESVTRTISVCPARGSHMLPASNGEHADGQALHPDCRGGN